MTIEWQTKELSEIAANASRPFKFVKHEVVVFVNTGDVHNGEFLHNNHSRIEGLPGQAKKRIERDDILFSEIRPANKRFAFVEHDCTDYVVSTKFMTIQAKDGLLPKYLYYYITSAAFLNEVQEIAESRSGTFPQITFDSISHLPIKYPKLEQQEHIVRFLDAMRTMSRLLNRINNNLESISETIFKSWFVDFDPVKAKMEGREPEGMDAKTASLFPDKLVESELGMIPGGWEVKSLSSIATFLNGLAMQKYPAIEGDPYFPVLKIAELRSGFGKRTNRANRDVPADYVINDGDIIFSWSGSLLAKQWSLGEAALNQHLFKVTSDSFPKWFYYQWILHHLPEFQAIAAGKATTMGHIQRKHLDEAKVLIPSSELMTSADTTFSPILEMQLANDLNSRTLEDLRDTLLPKLTSGEIQIPKE